MTYTLLGCETKLRALNGNEERIAVIDGNGDAAGAEEEPLDEVSPLSFLFVTRDKG